MLTSINKLSFLTPTTRQNFVFQKTDSWQKTAAKVAFWLSSIGAAGLTGYLTYQYGPSLWNKAVSSALTVPSILSRSTQTIEAARSNIPDPNQFTSTGNTTNLVSPDETATKVPSGSTIISGVIAAVFSAYALLTLATD